MPAIVLAGDRAGGNRLARAHGLPAGVLVEVAGLTCIARVIAALRESSWVNGGCVVGPHEVAGEQEPGLAELFAPGDFRWLAPAGGPAASALAGASRVDAFPALLTAGDHALLTGEIIDKFCDSASRCAADFVVALVPYETVHEAFPHSRRTRIRFRDGVYCGANLFLLRRAAARSVLNFWTQLEADRKRPWRMAARLGPVALWRYLVTGLTAADAFALLSVRSGASIDFVLLDDARAAVDVDSAADLELACQILEHD